MQHCSALGGSLESPVPQGGCACCFQRTGWLGKAWHGLSWEGTDTLIVLSSCTEREDSFLCLSPWAAVQGLGLTCFKKGACHCTRSQMVDVSARGLEHAAAFVSVCHSLTRPCSSGSCSSSAGIGPPVESLPHKVQ